jgi:hypothetical protein
VAGHEIAHSLWFFKKHDTTFEKTVEGYTRKVFLKKKTEFDLKFASEAGAGGNLFSANTARINDKAQLWAIEQVEESYCDFVALRIFGISYLHAIHYLLAPMFASSRHTGYPNVTRRIRNMVSAAQSYGIEVDELTEFSEGDFSDQSSDSLSEMEKFIVEIADEVRQSIVEENTGTLNLIEQAGIDIDNASIPLPSQRDAAIICESFRRSIPVDGAQSLADIINGGWLLFNDTSHRNLTAQNGMDYNNVLFDLVLKSIEVFEIEQLMQEQ